MTWTTTRPTRTGSRSRSQLALVALCALLLAFTACGDSSDSDDSTDTTDEVQEGSDEGEDSSADDDADDGDDDADEDDDADASTDIFGEENAATGDPVRIGLISDGATAAFDNTDELRAGEAAAEFLNAYRGGLGGQPIEVISCETGADPAGAADCANQMVEEDVVAVALGQSAVVESLWEPLHASGVPTMLFTGNGQALLADTESTFNMINPLGTAFGLPLSVADSVGTTKIAFVTIDVPAALVSWEGDGALAPALIGQAGLEYDLVKVPVGTADMTPQMQQVAESEAGLVHITGNDAFCIAAVQGLKAVGYEGEISAVAQCITDATREALPDGTLEGVNILATGPAGASDDPTYQLYEAVMTTYSEVEFIENPATLTGYSIVAALGAATEGIEGDVTSETIIEAIKAMPETDLPGGGGMTFQCGGSAIAIMPAVCSNQFLRTTLDADGFPTDYEVVDSSEFVSLG